MREGKLFHGLRTQRGCRVWVTTRAAMVPLAPRNDVRNHSPDGFEWGYGGSGPAQLALAICCELLEGDAARALAVYQDVKWRFISAQHADSFELDGAEVLAYIRERESLRERFFPEDTAGLPHGFIVELRTINGVRRYELSERGAHRGVYTTLERACEDARRLEGEGL